MEGSVTATVPLPRAGHQHSTTPRPHHPTSTPRPHHPTSTPGPRAHSHSINTMWTKSTRMANNKAPTTRARDSTEPSNVYDWAALTTTSLSDVTGDYMLEGGGGFLVSPTGVSPWRFLSQVGEVVTGVLHTGGGSITGVLHTGGCLSPGSFTQVEVYHRALHTGGGSITGVLHKRRMSITMGHLYRRRGLSLRVPRTGVRSYHVLLSPTRPAPHKTYTTHSESSQRSNFQIL